MSESAHRKLTAVAPAVVQAVTDGKKYWENMLEPVKTQTLHPVETDLLEEQREKRKAFKRALQASA